METLNKVEMGERIKQIRKKAKLRQWQLADILGTTQSAVHKYEHGVIPEPRRLVKLARLGNTTVEWILTGEHWEDGSQEQERLPLETYHLAEKLRQLGPDERRLLDDALRILTGTVDALRAPPNKSGGRPEVSDLAAHLSALSDKQRTLLAAAMRVQQALLDTVLDIEKERLEKADRSMRRQDGGNGSKDR